MGSRSTEIPMALLIPERCTAAKIAATPASPGATDSTFTEAGPRPGLPIVDDAYSPLRVEISHAQGAALDLRCIKSGSATRDGLQLACKLNSEAAASWRGWDGPALVTGWLRSTGARPRSATRSP